jgi:hypothetical protein
VVLCAQASDLTAVGIVAGIKGKWSRVKGDKKLLEVGDEIFPGTTVRTEASTVNFLKVALFDGKVWNQACSVPKPCEGSWAIPSPPPPERGFLVFLSSYFAAKKRVPVIFIASRAAGRTGPREAVLTITGGAIDLSAALGGITAGSWCITLSDPAKPRDSGLTRTLDWPREVSLRVGALAPGIYALDVRSESGDPLGSPAAVLLIDPRSGSGARDEFESAKALAAGWQDVDAAASRAFLVQALYAIGLEAGR